MKILIISAEVWQDGTNGGNVLTNMFSDMGADLAQIYCNPGTPQNTLCKHYFQMTDGMVLRNFLNRKPIGQTFDLKEPVEKEGNNSVHAEQPDKKFYAFFHQHRLGIFYSAKNLAWNLSNWKNEGLRDFILDFEPDVIFAPCYGSRFMLRLTRYVAELTGKSVISYISDDSYTLKQFNLSLFYWLERFSVRKQLRKTFPYYSLVYTMTETQKEQCEKDFGANMSILLKSVSFGEIPKKQTVGSPIRLVYAGGIYLNRWKTLAKVAEAIKEINGDEIKLVLDIYTGNEINSKIEHALNDGRHSRIHNSVSQEELVEIYHHSDIALHVESFDFKNRLKVKMSFSTKIVDCLASGCAVMAICDEKQGGFDYLKKENAAICVSDLGQIKEVLSKLVDSPKVLIDYAQKAKDCCVRNHNVNHKVRRLRSDFQKYCI